MKILHIDIETAPHLGHIWNLWRENIPLSRLIETGYILCWAAKWNDSNKIMYSSLYDSTPEEMLEAVWDLLDEADAVVHYNGRRFDIPTINAEFVQYGFAPPSPFHQIDLYKVVKKRFRLPSYKLEFVSKHFGVGEKATHAGYDTWLGCMAGEKQAFKDMREYNEQDVVLLQDLYYILLPWIQDHPNHGLYIDEERPVCPNCGSTHVKKNGTESTKTLTYQRYRCMDCMTPIRGKKNVMSAEKRASILTQSKL